MENKTAKHTINDFSNGSIIVYNDDSPTMRDLLVFVTGENFWQGQTTFYWIGENGEVWSNENKADLPKLEIVNATHIVYQKHA